MLYRNREKGGTGKLRTYWENKVYVVVERNPEIMLYTIKPESGNGNVKRVHRNNILLCNDILPDKVELTQNTPKRAKPSSDLHQRRVPSSEPSLSLPIVSSESPVVVKISSDRSSESEDEFVASEGVAEASDREEDVMERVDMSEESEVANEGEIDEDNGTNEADEDATLPYDMIDEQDDDSAPSQGDGDGNEAESESSEVESSDSAPPLRRGTRTRLRAPTFTYDENGNPVIERR